MQVDVPIECICPEPCRVARTPQEAIEDLLDRLNGCPRLTPQEVKEIQAGGKDPND